MQLFQFALGPVQSFVAQARRTRDFWAGSFLLSWLAGVAILATRRQDGRLRFPVVPESVLECLEGRGGDCPGYGGIPNRFEALVPDGFDPERVVQVIRQAWAGLGEEVWQADLAPLRELSGGDTRVIWERQMGAFWDVQWVLTPDLDDHAALDRRKNWRGRPLLPEGGVSCHLIEGWQELSGATGPRDPRLPAFWAAVRKRVGPAIREGEYLSAPALVKRRFAGVFPRFRLPVDDGWILRGWEVGQHGPSVDLVAAYPWLQQLFTLAQADRAVARAVDRLVQAGRALTGGHGEEDWPGELRGSVEEPVRRWRAAPASVWFPTQLANPRVWDEPDPERLEEAQQALQQVGRLVADRLPRAPAPFYAVLVMDGDEMGALLRQEKPEEVSAALAAFTGAVPGLVEEAGGWTVYAGGDDVVAFLPLPSALDAAARLREQYRAAFRERGMTATISAAVVYPHITLPLMTVLAAGHSLLDTVAKADRGRDAVACEVLLPGGAGPRWAMPWERALRAGRVLLAELADAFAGGDAVMAGMTSRFFYRLRERWQELVREPRPAMAGAGPDPGSGEPVLDPEVFGEVLAMEYLQAGENRSGLSREEARQRVGWLLDQCRVVRRRRGPAGVQWQEERRWELDGALLLRFLALRGREGV
ncbi:MAG: type III-B CRISPR-associated protein Cas10/Cmr2 [Firmicutes bacterium]|nr:type III-B CRISPR-associated protein Cas10/Cmr2 [Bacillota bacterium]